MNYALFYNYKAAGDVLMIIINPILDMTSFVKDGDVVTIYHDEEIIGYNLFNISHIIKIHHKGMIVSPIAPLVDVINNVLKNHNLPLLKQENETCFIIGQVVDIKNNIYKVDIKSEILEISSNKNISVLDKVVVALPKTIMPNAEIVNKAKIMTYKNMMLNDSDEILKIDEGNIGSDFYLGEIKWNN